MTVEKEDSYESLDHVLQAKCKDEQVRGVIRDMLHVCADITQVLRTALVTTKVGGQNVNEFGQGQRPVDVSSTIVR